MKRIKKRLRIYFCILILLLIPMLLLTKWVKIKENPKVIVKEDTFDLSTKTAKARGALYPDSIQYFDRYKIRYTIMAGDKFWTYRVKTDTLEKNLTLKR